MNLIQGVTMVKPESSRYGTFSLYATPKFQDTNEARNDFVLVQAKNSTGQEVIRVAQLLILLKMYTTSSGKIKFFALVRYLNVVHIREQPNSNIQCPFKLLQWNVDSEIQLIRVNDIISPACLFPFQEANVSVAPTTKIWHMKWKFCD